MYTAQRGGYTSGVGGFSRAVIPLPLVASAACRMMTLISTAGAPQTLWSYRYGLPRSVHAPRETYSVRMGKRREAYPRYPVDRRNGVEVGPTFSSRDWARDRLSNDGAAVHRRQQTVFFRSVSRPQPVLVLCNSPGHHSAHSANTPTEGNESHDAGYQLYNESYGRLVESIVVLFRVRGLERVE